MRFLQRVQFDDNHSLNTILTIDYYLRGSEQFKFLSVKFLVPKKPPTSFLLLFLRVVIEMVETNNLSFFMSTS